MAAQSRQTLVTNLVAAIVALLLSLWVDNVDRKVTSLDADIESFSRLALRDGLNSPTCHKGLDIFGEFNEPPTDDVRDSSTSPGRPQTVTMW